MIRILMIASMFVMLTTGCVSTSFKDIDKRFFVLAIGLDKEEVDGKDKYLVSLKLAIPSAKFEVGDMKSQIISQTSDTIPEALRMIRANVDKELDFGHTKILVIGESLARTGITEAVDFFTRRSDIQGVAYMMVGSPSAEDILNTTTSSERMPTNALTLSFGKVGTESAYIMTAQLFDFYRRMNEKGMDPFLPIVKSQGKSFMINQVGLFNKEKMKLALNPEETRLLNELMYHYQYFEIITITKEIQYTLATERFKRSFKFSPADKERVKINVSFGGIVEQSSQRMFENDWREYEEAAEEASTKRYLALLHKLQKAQLDPIGLGMIYTAAHYNGQKDWEEWQRIYPRLVFDLKVKVKIYGTGVTK
ncbi:germination protein [Paenibacillus glycanilyticus]|uniref:Germination protein n=1 Tax=Paenibacillus glycanilyticus TaxID=126569 RepID=A0ABQ6NJI0_9BACL|nr:Ger(x)C family spore germination protein [Paenibacillus glycanilyticus]GMK44265.1 germination protein [Paenibacillus glycanilyticus]